MPLVNPKRMPADCDLHACNDRNRIERMFNKLRQSRHITARCDSTTLSFLGFLNIAASRS